MRDALTNSAHAWNRCAVIRVDREFEQQAGERQRQRMEGQDAMIAQLMGMGFRPVDIEEYQVATASSSEGFSLQAATEWSVNNHRWL